MENIINNLDLITVSIAIALNSIVGFIVYYRNRISITGRTFFAFSIVTCVWGLLNYFYYQVGDPIFSLWFLRGVMFFAVWQSFFLYQLFIVFPEEKYFFSQKYRYLLIPLVVSVSILTLTPIVFVQVAEKVIIGQVPKVETAYGILLFGALNIFLIIRGIVIFLKKIIKAERQKRKPYTYVLWGVFLMFSFIVLCNFILPVFFDNQSLIPFGALFSFPFIILTSYSIVKHHLFDIKIIARRSVVYLLTLGTILLPAALLQYFIREYLHIQGLFVDFLILAAAVLAYNPLRNYYFRFANTYLFSSLYDSKNVIRTLSDKLRSTIDIKIIYQYITETLTAAFHSKSIAIRVYDRVQHCFSSAYVSGDKKEATHCVDDAFIEQFLNHNGPFFLSELSISFPKDIFIKTLIKDGFEVITPLTIKDQVVGAILLSQKETQEAYNDEDMQVLNVVGASAAIAIENALLFEEAKQFNATLRKKIDGATKKLQTQNIELQRLDQLKSEFISVASHQLRTPLTASKWALESLAKGKKGRLTAEESETVQDLQLSNNKLIKQVNELLNISRIEEGRLRIDPKPVDLVAIIRETIHEDMPIAEKMKLKVIQKFDKLPLINLDENVIGKAISNFISNGIKYNRLGKRLEVTLKKDGANALLTVKDQGIGIPEAEQKNIFQRFFRASNASTSQTEGTGLGMYIAKSAIELSGGKVWFESAVGKGSTFYVSLPLRGSKAIGGEKSLA